MWGDEQTKLLIITFEFLLLRYLSSPRKEDLGKERKKKIALGLDKV